MRLVVSMTDEYRPSQTIQGCRVTAALADHHGRADAGDEDARG